MSDWACIEQLPYEDYITFFYVVPEFHRKLYERQIPFHSFLPTDESWGATFQSILESAQRMKGSHCFNAILYGLEDSFVGTPPIPHTFPFQHAEKTIVASGRLLVRQDDPSWPLAVFYHLFPLNVSDQ